MTGLCEALKVETLLAGYAFGDFAFPQYYKSDGTITELNEGRGDAAVIYVRCQRFHGHPGLHLAKGVTPWGEV